jgi:anti-sigma28 factor (negative regulator of flagellin synthesis)
MKVDARVLNYMELLQNGPARSAAPEAGASGKQAIAEAPSVAVDLSSEAVQRAEDEVRRERLNIIRQQLAEGSYNISGKDVATKILNVLKG